jgi:deoxyadenosine/deoxycytidine kinase
MPIPNLIYLSGPHGSGKTTLEKELEKENPLIFVPELKTRNPKFHTDPEYRLILKIGSRAIENYEYLETARANPEKIILANRCVYDVQAYSEVYMERGWSNKNKEQIHNRIIDEFFPGENKAPYAIVLNPPFAVVQRHLEERWKKKGKKWMEDDLRYTELACETFKQFRNHPNIFYIDHEVNLESRVEIKEANEWIMKKTAKMEAPAPLRAGAPHPPAALTVH